MRAKKTSFPYALKYIADLMGYDKSELQQAVRLPFGGFYKNITRQLEEPELSIKTYPDEAYQKYETGFSSQFFKDGIDFQTQEYFNIGFDIETLRTTIPEFTMNGDLCGIMGRSINNDCAKEERWLPIIPCSRSLTLYGYHRNYQSIQEKQLVVVLESEKSVCQLHTIGCFNALATCGCHVSETQKRHLKGLLVPRTILAYDEGLDEEFVREEAKKLLVDNAVYKNKVGYIYDREHKYLTKGSKDSPSDRGKDIFLNLVKECTVWL